MKFKNGLFSMVFGFALFSVESVFAGNPACPQGHCSRVNNQINESCKALGLAGKAFPVVREDGSVCDCPCSCVASQTEIAINKRLDGIAIASLRVGDQALAVGESFSVARVDRMLGDANLQQHKVVDLVMENGKTLRVSTNHTFVQPNKILVQASALKIGDEVLDVLGKPVKVSSLETTQIMTQLFNLIVNEKSYEAVDHIVGTEGLMSGDWMLQAEQDSVEHAIDVRLGKIKPVKVSL